MQPTQARYVHLVCDPVLARKLDVTAARLGRSIRSCTEEALHQWVDPSPDLGIPREHAEHVARLLRILNGDSSLADAMIKSLAVFDQAQRCIGGSERLESRSRTPEIAIRLSGNEENGETAKRSDSVTA